MKCNFVLLQIVCDRLHQQANISVGVENARNEGVPLIDYIYINKSTAKIDNAGNSKHIFFSLVCTRKLLEMCSRQITLH